MARIIEVKTCKECPFLEENDGGGFTSEFTKCSKFDIMLIDWDGPEYLDIYSKIHPDCELKEEN